MVDEIALIVAVCSGGLAGSALTAVVTHFRSSKEQKESTKRVRALVKHELTAARNHIADELMLKGSTEGDGTQVGYRIDNTYVLKGEKLIESLKYPKFTEDTKVKAFDSNTLEALQDAYSTLDALKVSRIRINEALFRYDKTVLESWRDHLDKVIEQLD